MENALWLCLIPIIWVLVTRFALKREITWKEAGLQGSCSILLVIAIYAALAWSNVSDKQILNGEVTGKEKNWVSCEHSYSCNCREECSGSGDSRSCSTVCDTCYEHMNDWDWDVYTTVGDETIDRIDDRGEEMPPRWDAVKIGEPAAREKRYTNYVLAAPNSLFNMALAEEEAKTKAALIPSYPKVHDYYRVNRVLSVGVSVPTADRWNELLNDALRSMGAQYQVNIVLVFVKGQDRSYAQMLERAWLGGKKNDVTIVVGTDGTKIDWVEAFTFGKTAGNAMLAIKLRDNLQELGTTEDPDKGVEVATTAIKQHFTRKQMSDYEYLKAEGGPTTDQVTWLIGTILILLAISSFLLWKYDVLEEEGFKRVTRGFRHVTRSTRFYR